MKLKTKRLLLTSLLALAIPLICSLNTEATQSFYGDGATPSGTGRWSIGSAGIHQCLHCHKFGGIATDEAGYLMTGHKNMLRKVSPGVPWAGADGTIYGTTDDFYGSGSIYNWTAGTVNVAGTGTIKQIFYIFGGWLSPDELDTIFDGGFTGELYPNGNYDCGRCHTTGYQFDASGPEPTTYNSARITDAQFSRIPTDYTTGTSSWYLNGIQCERCHNATGHPADPFPFGTAASKPTYENATALCIECHRQESADTVSNTITLSTDLEVSNDDPAIWAPFFDASIGQAFLNSPHARFTGNLAQTSQNSPDLSVSMTGTYSSNFKNSTPGPDFDKNKGCDGCHDVHQSLVEGVNAAAPITNKCGIACHTTEGALSGIHHPSGPGTPIGTDVAGACKTCHMPNAYHLFRISVDANYRTFPTETQFNSGQTTAKTASDGILAGAVWIDVDLACGQCHGGGVSSTDNPPNGAWYMTKSQLAVLAKGMHGITGNSCAATLNSDLSFHVPYGTFNGKAYWADLTNIPGTVNFTLSNFGLITDTTQFAGCPPATLSGTFLSHIPNMTVDGVSFWLDLQSDKDQWGVFSLIDMGFNPQ
jgi:hypothetical protein